jgi:hypothetical protein
MQQETMTLSTLMLDVHDLAAVISDVGLDVFLDEMIDDLRSNVASFDSAIGEHQIRAGFNYVSPEEGLVEWMPTMVARDVVSVKTVGPVFDLSGARSNLHINAVGADFPGKTELPMDYLRSAVVIPDVVEQCMIEGESQLLERGDLGPSMVEVSEEQFRTSSSKPRALIRPDGHTRFSWLPDSS